MIERISSGFGAVARASVGIATALAAALYAGASWAAGEGLARPWQLGYQDAASPVMEDVNDFHNLLMVIITVITVFVLGLLLYIILRFNSKANPVPSKTAHNTLLEVIWTAVPIVILVAIAIPSFKLLYYADRAVEPEMTLKAIGNQWYWDYEYPDHPGVSFSAVMLSDEERKADQPRLLATDETVIVPVDTVVQVLITSNDVLHAWAMPAFGVKLDAVPGRLNETWFKATRTGMFYGQCSELCGKDHGFMPIQLKVVSKQEFADWIKVKQAAAPMPADAGRRLAEAAR